eukprot:TRINITY_DN6914_c0_g1_i1.p1 TRINITY_DN6914_c0_g1~~TRINITY_DN6914_c0_g1_i1.p1  ORF type:complete len:199 (+),score=12.45 TRINITY_DN6914_c0_g1_i1:481-1077(+)
MCVVDTFQGYGNFLCQKVVNLIFWSLLQCDRFDILSKFCSEQRLYLGSGAHSGLKLALGAELEQPKGFNPTTTALARLHMHMFALFEREQPASQKGRKRIGSSTSTGTPKRRRGTWSETPSPLTIMSLDVVSCDATFRQPQKQKKLDDKYNLSVKRNSRHPLSDGVKFGRHQRVPDFLTKLVLFEDRSVWSAFPGCGL